MPSRWLTIGLIALLLGALMAGSVGADKVVIINNYGYTPFVYSGFAYVPLRSAADFLGAALLWDSLKGRALLTYNGETLALVLGSPRAIFVGSPVILPAPLLFVEDRLFIPLVVIKQVYRVPVIWDRKVHQVRILGPSGWGAMAVAPRAPKHVVRYYAPGRAKKLVGHRMTGRVKGPPGYAKAKGKSVGPGSYGKAKGRSLGPPGQAKGKAKGQGKGHGRGPH